MLDALRRVRPALKDGDLKKQADTVIAAGAKDLAAGGGKKISDEEALRFAEAAERIRGACGAGQRFRRPGSGRSILKDQFRRARISGSAADTRPR